MPELITREYIDEHTEQVKLEKMFICECPQCKSTVAVDKYNKYQYWAFVIRCWSCNTLFTHQSNTNSSIIGRVKGIWRELKGIAPIRTPAKSANAASMHNAY